MSHVIKMIGIISPNRFSNISSNIIKVVIKHISYVPRIHMDNIIMNYLLHSIFYLTIFWVYNVIDDPPSLLYSFCSIELMFIIILLWSSNLSGDEISEMSIKIFRNFILKVPPRCRTLQYSRTEIREIYVFIIFYYIGLIWEGHPSRCPSGTILLTPYSMVWDWRVSRTGPMLLYWPKLLYPYYSLLLFFPLSSFCL